MSSSNLLVPTAAHAVAAVPLQNPQPPPGEGPEFGKSSPIGLVVVILLAIVTVFLIRGMSKRVKRLPASFDPEPAPERADAGDTAAQE